MSVSVRGRRVVYRLAVVFLRLIQPLVPSGRGGVKCVLTDGDRVLLVRHTYGLRRWDLPGGNGRRGERPSDAARREMHEELGLEIDRFTPLGQLTFQTGRHRRTVEVCAAELSSPSLRLDPAEIELAAWFERERLPLDTAPFVAPILAAAAPHDRPL